MNTTNESIETAPASARNRGRSLVWVVVALVVVSVPVVVIALSVLAGPEEDKRAARATERGRTPQWEMVSRQDFDIVVTASGDIQAGSQVEVRNMVKSKTSIVDVVEEGSHVKKGDWLMTLADDDLVQLHDAEKLDVAEARAQKTAAEKSLEIAKAKAKATERLAIVTKELAELDLEKWRNGVLVQRRNELTLGLEKAKRTLKRAEEDLRLSENLLKERFISQKDYDADELAVIEAKAALATAELDIKVFETYEYPKDLRKFSSDVDKATSDLETTLAENERTLEQGQSALDTEIQQLQIHEDRLAELDSQLAATKINAPTDGMVVFGTTISRHRGDDDSISKGSSVYFNQTLIVMPDTSHMSASVLVHEAMIASVKAGNKVTVQVDALQGDILEGIVSKVDQSAEDGGWWNRDLRQYRVRVDLSEKGIEQLKPAMRCVARIVTDRVQGQLAIPVQAVHSERRQKFCYVPAGSGKVRRQPVKIGRSSETQVEIVSGLEEGDRVLLRRPHPGEEVN